MSRFSRVRLSVIDEPGDHGRPPWPGRSSPHRPGSPRPRPGDSEPSRERSVLLVDDNDLLRQMMVRLLSRRGWSTTACDRADDALALLQERSFDLVVTDMVMPGMSGAALVAAIEQLRPEQPVIIISGYLADGVIDVTQALASGRPIRWLAKPFPMQDLLRLADDLLGGDDRD